MALVVGNLPSLIDPASSSRISFHTRPSTLDLVSHVPNKLRDSILLIHNPHPPSSANSSSCASPLDYLDATDSWTHRGARLRPNSKANNAYDFGTSNGSNGNGDEDDGSSNDYNDWGKEMRKRVKEIEEMKELEKKAEELQSQMANEQSEAGVEESEEEKKERVRRELEKVAKEQAERRKTAKLMFEVGQKAYEKGMYGRAIEFLEGALTIIPKATLFGGEFGICRYKYGLLWLMRLTIVTKIALLFTRSWRRITLASA